MPWCLSYFSIFLKEIRNNGEKLNKCPTCAVLFSVNFQCGAKKNQWNDLSKIRIKFLSPSSPDWFERNITTPQNFWFFSVNIAKHIQLLSSTKYAQFEVRDSKLNFVDTFFRENRISRKKTRIIILRFV